MFYCRCFFSPRVLRGSSADRRETLPHDRKLAEFYNSSPKIGVNQSQLNYAHQKCGAKNMQNFDRFYTAFIANISGTKQDIQNRKK